MKRTNDLDHRIYHVMCLSYLISGCQLETMKNGQINERHCKAHRDHANNDEHILRAINVNFSWRPQ